jgi:4-hydroxy-tetrahydrodipicolinate synthase
MTAAKNGEAARALALYAIAPTMFSSDGETVDAAAMAAATQWLVGEGIRDFLLTGSYGEFQSLTDDERVSVLRAVRSVAGVRTVMACAALPAAPATARLGERLLGEGADEVMVAAPLAAEVSPAEVFRHFEHLSQRLPGRIVIYNNPVFGIDLRPDDLAGITSLPGIVAVKQGTSSLSWLAESITAIRARSSGQVRVLAASDLSAMLGLLAGASGLTSTNSWVFPQAIRSIVAAAAAGEWESARQIAAALEPYFAVARRFGQPRTVKAAMRLRGLPGTDAVRVPYQPLDASEYNTLQAALGKCDDALTRLGHAQQQSAESRQ